MPQRLYISIAVILALAVHFQITVGARFAASDVIVLGLLPLLPFAVKRVTFHPWGIALGACTLVLLVALLRGPMDSWALTKVVGWPALIAYGVVGWMLREHYPLFARVFVLLLCVFVLIFLGFTILGLDWTGPYDPRFSGFMGNPNAFALVLLCGVVVSRDAFVRWEPFAGVLAAGVVYSWSMAGVLALAVVALTWFAATRAYKSTALVAVVGCLVYFAPIIVNTGLHAAFELVPKAETDGLSRKFNLFFGDQGFFGDGGLFTSPEATPEGQEPPPYLSPAARLASYEKAISQWQTAPVLGIGLGTYWHRFRDEGLIIHSTPIWLLVETGVVGFLAFLSLLGTFTWFLWRQRLYTGLLILLGWGVMALPHEFLYQRIPWLLLGLILPVAVGATGRQKQSEPAPVRRDETSRG